MDIENNSLIEYKNEVNKEIENLLEKIKSQSKTREYIPYSSYILFNIKDEIINIFKSYGISINSPEEIELNIPPSHIDADITLSVFQFSKSLKKSPNIIAKELSDYINNTDSKLYLKSTTPINGYINIILNKNLIYNKILNSINKLEDKYGYTDLYKGKTVIIDFSSPNIAKPFGIGHIRSTVIGQSLANIYNAIGFTVIRDNHLGDWGTQFGKLIYAYRNWGNEEIIKKNPIEELKNLYVKFNDESIKNPELKDEAKKLFSQLEHGDKELIEIWKKFRDLSLKDFQRIYDKLGTKFDCMLGESYYAENFNELISDLKNKGIAKDSEDGAVIVEELNGLPTFLLQKNDGSTLYILRDIITLIHRKKTFNPNTVLYIVGSEQKLNFQQLFAICNKAEYSKDIELKHIDFGLVMVDGSKMATRSGNLVNLENVLDQITVKAKEILIQKGDIDLNNIDKIAEIVGTSAIIYADLKQNRNSNIDFDWNRILSLESGSSVYLQYTYARILSILSKTDFKSINLNEKDNFIFDNSIEFRLVLKLAFFPEILLQSIKNNTPNTISIFLEELTTDFNSFYSQISIIKTDNIDLKNSRLVLINAVAINIKNALSMLNIPIIERI